MIKSRRPIENVYLPGDKELYAEYIKRQAQGFFRIVPHDHQAYNMRSQRTLSKEEQARLKRVHRLIKEILYDDEP